MRNPDRFLTLGYCKLLTTADKRAPRSGADYERPGVCEEIRKFERAFVKRAAEYQIPIYCSEMMRSQTRQIELYVTGQSPDMPGHSAHEIGQACDLVHADFKMQLPVKCWQILGHMGQEIAVSQGSNILWGGPLRPDHWEIM